MNAEKVLLKILFDLDGFPKSDKNDVEELIEHNELGVAFEIICSTLEQENIKVHISNYQLIKELGLKMNMPETLWKEIKYSK